MKRNAFLSTGSKFTRMNPTRLVALVTGGLLNGFFVVAVLSAFAQSGAQRIEPLRVWNDRDLADWATPVGGLNVRPGHYSEEEYYSAPVGEFVRTYPVYFPGREPAGYWDRLRNAKSEPLITPGPRTMADWVKEGKRVFHE